MVIKIGSEIEVINPNTEIKSWVKQNLVINNPEYTKKARLGLWLKGTPRKLSLYKVTPNSLILPYGTINKLSQFFLDSVVENNVIENEGVEFEGDLTLYDYQKEAVENVTKNFAGILESPAGSGKTQMGLGIIQKLGKRALWLTHTKDLLTQSKNRAEQFFDKSLMGTITEGKVVLGEGITFATVQTMVNVDLNQLKDYFDVIIVDEVHRVCGTPTAMTSFYKVLNSLSAKYKYGLTATVHRADDMITSTFAIIGNVTHKVKEENVEDKIMQVGVKVIETSFKITDKCLASDGTLSYHKFLETICNDRDRNTLISNKLKSEKENSCLILSTRLSHLESIYELLSDELKEKSVIISGTTSVSKREKVFEDIKQGKIKFLFATFNLAKEGLDIPILSRLFLTIPQKDYAIVTQSVGRIARVCKGKENAVVYDFLDIGRYFEKNYKKRLSSYKKLNCYMEE